jgi:L-ascorbate metabolism protein UlaG (beta-lactamase superfamily)
MGRKGSTLSWLALLALTLALVCCNPAATSTLTPSPTVAPTATPLPAPSAAETQVWLDAQLNPGEAVIWYLGHCGYAIRTQNHFLIFDYQEEYDGQARKRKPSVPGLENGFIVPQQIAGFPVRVFATHSHTDHFNRLIFNWKGQIPDIAYYFGWQADSDPSYHYLIGPRAELSSDGMEIYTINSAHAGVPEVAYLVKVDGLVIYHNGDYMGDFQADFPFLHEVTDHIDLTFTIRGYEDDSVYFRQNLDLFQRFQHGAVFPTHDTAGRSGYAQFERVFLAQVPGLPIFSPRRVGERFLYQNGQATRSEQS